MTMVADPLTSARERVLTFAHIGDLHLTDAKQRNFKDFLAIVAQIASNAPGRSTSSSCRATTPTTAYPVNTRSSPPR